MLIGRIRPTETLTREAQAEDQATVRAQLEAQTPHGFDLVSAPVSMKAGTVGVSATGTYARRDGVETIEADTMPALLAKVPDGYQLITVRRG